MKATMLESVPTAGTPAAIGAELRRGVTAEPDAASASALRLVGGIDIQLIRSGDRWRLFLQGGAPIPHGTRDIWATAVSAPSVEWQRTTDGRLVWCEWVE